MPSTTLLDKLKKLCRVHGCRCTKQRIAVYKYICGNKTHPSVDQIWHDVRKKTPSITRESVFRILMEFSEWGIVYRMDKIINARFDGIPGDHGHFICRKCGAIIDFEIPGNMPHPAVKNGFLPDHFELRVSGLCAECAAQKEQKTKGNSLNG